MTSAALIGAGGVAAVYAAFERRRPTTVVRQVTVERAPPARRAFNSRPDDQRDLQAHLPGRRRPHRRLAAADTSLFGGAAAGRGLGLRLRQGTATSSRTSTWSPAAVTVKFWNGKTYHGDVVGGDRSTDLAVIKVERRRRACIRSRSATPTVEVGDGVVAIGSPFGLARRHERHRQRAPPAIDRRTIHDQRHDPDRRADQPRQLRRPADRPERPVIGVNSQIESDSGGSDGVGFAIPSNTVKRIVEPDLKRHVDHAYLGVPTETSTNPAGAKIATVRSGTPAADSALTAGDAVTAVDGEAVTSSGRSCGSSSMPTTRATRSRSPSRGTATPSR